MIYLNLKTKEKWDKWIKKTKENLSGFFVAALIILNWIYANYMFVTQKECDEFHG